MWIARDKDDNEVWLYKDRPAKNSDNSYYIGDGDIVASAKLSSYGEKELEILFGITDLTFENSPIEIEVKVKQ